MSNNDFGYGFKINVPKPIGQLVIQEGMILCAYTDPKHKPNAWRKFWYWFLLGWKWEDINDEG